MAASLLLLLDDIATVMDDVAVMSKVAAKKTAGVLGDDLALNAQQVSGVRADRELPIVWRVTKGSFVNKLILVPLALLISWFMPALITPLLMIGGLYLCYEGIEKIVHSLLHRHQTSAADLSHTTADAHVVPLDEAGMKAFEDEKVKGAVRTDFILSAEIVVISLGTLALNTPFIDKVLVLSLISIVMTVGVYGLVALIVKIDDAGLYLVERKSGALAGLGRGLLKFAPILMKLLSIVGTAAMFLVGGGIIAHGLPFFHHATEAAVHQSQQIPNVGMIIGHLVPTLINLAIGLVAGLIALGVVNLLSRIRSSK